MSDLPTLNKRGFAYPARAPAPSRTRDRGPAAAWRRSAGPGVDDPLYDGELPDDDPATSDEHTLSDAHLRLRLPAEAPTPTLMVLTGVDTGRVEALRPGSTTIGRVPGQGQGLTLAHESVSRRHCELRVDARGQVWVRDLGSTNGTLLDGAPVPRDPPRLVPSGGLISLSAQVLLRIDVQDPLTAAVQEELYQKAVRDPLTGAYNKRYLVERLQQDHAQARRSGRPLAVLVIDLDHFKRVNDTHGHAAGDAVLRATALALREELRAEDLVARFGGEEFVALLRDGPPAQAHRVAERLRERVKGLRVPHEGRLLQITASIGVATSDERGLDVPADLFARADRRLYAAKAAGRDRIAVADPA